MPRTDFIAIIPARFGSTRLPEKPLLDIHGKPMIAHVIDKAKAAGAKEIIVATDHQAVFEVVETYGVKACMTSIHHESGTERLAEVIKLMGIRTDEIIINIQGDEPLVPPELIVQLANNLANAPYEMATLATPIVHVDEIFNPNVVKVVRNKNNEALYFSRATIPWDRETFSEMRNITKSSALTEMQVIDTFKQKILSLGLLRHLGIYAYRAGFIEKYVKYERSPLESIELLEQLRVLWHGIKLHVDIASIVPEAGVDTLEDLERVRRYFIE